MTRVTELPTTGIKRQTHENKKSFVDTVGTRHRIINHSGIEYHVNDNGRVAGKWMEGSGTGVTYHSSKKEVKEDTMINSTAAIAMEEGVTTAGVELFHFGRSDGRLHRQSHIPIINNLRKKVAKGVYDHTKATKLWKYHADRAAQSYAAQHGDGKTPWHKQFSPADRKVAAQMFADHGKNELGLFNEETITELSKGLLGRYVKKALPSMEHDRYKAIENVKTANSSGKRSDKQYFLDAAKQHRNRANKRLSGINAAVDKLTKEETLHEVLDTRDKKIAYIKAAQDNAENLKAFGKGVTKNPTFERARKHSDVQVRRSAKDMVHTVNRMYKTRLKGISGASRRLAAEETIGESTINSGGLSDSQKAVLMRLKGVERQSAITSMKAFRKAKGNINKLSPFMRTRVVGYLSHINSTIDAQPKSVAARTLRVK